MTWSKLILVVLVSCWANYSKADGRNLIANGGAELGTKGWIGISLFDRDAFTGLYSFAVTQKKPKQTVASWYLIPVDARKKYKFSGHFKSIGKTPAKITLQVACYDQFMRKFNYYAVNVHKGTDTTLVAAAKKGTTLLRIADGNSWQATPHSGVAFYVDDSGKYQNLPSHNLSPVGIKLVKNTNKTWIVELNKPLTNSYPAGCKIRLHRRGAKAITMIPLQTIPTKWTELSFKLNGIRKLFATSSRSRVKLWPYTKYIAITIIVEGQPEVTKLLLDDLTLSEAN